MAEDRRRDWVHAVPGQQRGHETTRAEGAGSVAGGRTGECPLAWPLAAMTGALRRFGAATNAAQAAAAAIEAAWWITTADAAMSRRHPRTYSHALAALDPAQRRAVEASLAGFRFIRRQLGYHADPADFIQADAPSRRYTAAWGWSRVCPPPPQRGTAREPSPYREYQAQLAGRPVAEALERTAGFLAQAHADIGHAGHKTESAM